MPILTCRDLTLHFGERCIFDHVNVDIEAGERLCLTGRNGSGKSTFLKLVAGTFEPDSGVIWRRQNLGIAVLNQALPERSDETIFNFVKASFSKALERLAELDRISTRYAAAPTRRDERAIANLHRAIEHDDGWTIDHKVDAVLDRLSLPGSTTLRHLSGGWLRRVAIARALVSEPDLLVLDEPTNHLDIPAIDWLETLLLAFEGTALFVTHDRELMRRVATAVVDLDMSSMQRWNGGYDDFVKRKAAQRAVDEQQAAALNAKLNREENWYRQGVKARTTRNQGRVKALEKLREQRRQRRSQSALKLEVDHGHRSGNIIKELTGVSKAYGDTVLINDLDLIIRRGDRLGILGPNGCGKSTLLRMLLQDESPDRGTIRTGTRLAPVYFDQLRTKLDGEKRVADTITDGRPYVTINGRDQHVVSYLANFMFTPEHAKSPVRVLSGGEQNRLLLAKLFSTPANVLVLDEPTNDLDVDSLELLESMLLDYPGTVLLVTHDRSFLDNVVTSLLVFEGDGRVVEHIGGYSDWIDLGGSFDHYARIGKSVDRSTARSDTANPPGDTPTVSPDTATGQRPSLSSPAKPVPQSDRRVTDVSTQSYEARKAAKKAQQKRARDLDRVTVQIEKLEQEIRMLHATMAEPGFYSEPRDKQRRVSDALHDADNRLRDLYATWETLEEDS